MQEAPDVNGLAEYLRERWAQLAGSRRQLQSSVSRHKQQQITDKQPCSSSGRCWDSQWTCGVEGSQVGRQHVFSAVETVQRRWRNATWSRRAEGKTTSTSLSVGIRAALTVRLARAAEPAFSPDKQSANQGGQADKSEHGADAAVKSVQA